MSDSGLLIRICGKVQGVGFRPFVWQLADRLRLYGEVCNDSAGVEIRLLAPVNIETFIGQLQRDCPPLARIDSISVAPFDWQILRKISPSRQVVKVRWTRRWRPMRRPARNA